jgi:hypothetical protein
MENAMKAETVEQLLQTTPFNPKAEITQRAPN